MTYQPPTGTRDLLPLDVAQKCWIEQRLQQVFHRWSYHRIITPTLERLETLMAGGAIQPETVIQLRDAEEGILGLRPELTASIARAAVTRMAGASLPQRLYYNANIFRRQPEGGGSSQQEFYQAGVELIGGSGLLADAEILLLLADCLEQLNLKQWHLILGEANLTRSLLSPFPLPVREQVRHCIAHLDRVGLQALSLPPELQKRALLLFDLRGRPADVLQQVASLALEPEQQAIVNRLKSLVELLDQRLSLVLDLSLIQTIDYYTGIVFEVVVEAETSQRILGQGGRYDQLLGLYHPQGQTIPGIGFSLSIEDLFQVLLPGGQLPWQLPASDWLVVPETPEAYGPALAHAQHLRTQATALVRVELALESQPPQGGAQASPAASRAYAHHRRIAHIAWVKADGSVQTENVSSAGPAARS